MAVCFVCDAKLSGERTRVCSSITPHSNASYPEKIGELVGDDFVIIVTPSDHMCKRCTSLLIHMDKLENDLKLVKNALIAYIQKKYGLLPADQPIKSIEVVNGNIRTDDLEVGQRKVPSGLVIKEPSSSSNQLKTRQDNASKVKIYKCGFCIFQSKDLGHVRFHMRSHMKKKEGEKSNQNTVTKPVTQQQPQQQQQTQQHKQQQQQPKKRLYRCQVCSASYDTKSDCLDHIQKDHNHQPTLTTEEKETDDTLQTAPVFQPHTSNSTENQQVVNKSDNECNLIDKSTMDTDKLLNDNKPNEGTEVTTMQETQNSSENMSDQTELVKVNREIPVTNIDMSDMAIGGGETGTDHLDIESMLAAIHNEDVRDAQNLI